MGNSLDWLNESEIEKLRVCVKEELEVNNKVLGNG